MSKIALTTAVVVLAVAPLTMARGEGQALRPWMPLGTAPPWASTTTTETTTAATPAAVPAAQSPPMSVDSGMVMPIPATVTPMQGTTTPIQAVSLRAGPNTGAPVIGTLQPGMPLRVLATANFGWEQVESPAGSGWAYGSYLAPAGNSVVIQHQAPPQEIISR